MSGVAYRLDIDWGKTETENGGRNHYIQQPPYPLALPPRVPV